MKLTTKFFAMLLLLALLLMPTQAVSAKGLEDGRVVLAGVYNLKSGETLEGDLVVIGGAATIEAGATINGSAVLIGGSLTMNGLVTGDIAVIGGAANLGDESMVKGDLITVGVGVTRAEGSVVQGQIISGASGPVIEFGGVGSTVVPPIEIEPPVGNGSGTGPDVAGLVRAAFNPVAELGGLLLRSIALGVLALLLMLFLHEPTERVANAVARQGALAGGMGLLTVFVAPLAVVLMVITIILIPVAALAVMALGVAMVFGWIGLGLEVGQRFTQMLKVNWPVPVAAGLGTFLLTLVANGIAFIPCVGWLAPVVLGFIGLGAVVMTRFGTRMVVSPMMPGQVIATAPITPSGGDPLPPAS
jgi:hypothetical protein